MKRKWSSYAGTAYGGYKSLKGGVNYVQRALKSRRLAKYGNKAAKANKPTGGTTVTSQRDLSIKKYGKGNVYKRKKEERLRKKIQGALEPKLTQHTYNEVALYTDQVVTTFAGSVSEQYVSSNNDTYYGLNMGNLTANGVTYIKNNLHNLTANTNVAAGAQPATNIVNRDIRILSSQIQLSLLNPTSVAILYDVYTFVATQDISDNAYSTPVSAWANLMALNKTLTVSGGTAPTPYANGIIPYDAPGFAKYWKVLEKQRVYLGGGQTSEFITKGSKYTLKGGDTLNKYALKGISKYMLVVAAIGNNSQLPVASIVASIVTQRKYRVSYTLFDDQIPNLPTNTMRVI